MAVDHVQTQDEFEKLWNQVVARTWTDAAFKQRLLTEASTVLAEQGIQIPHGVDVRVHEGSQRTANFTLPPSLSDELTDAELDVVSGGGSTTCSAVCCSMYAQFCSCDLSKCRT
jgi:hypothetical protein